MLVLKYLKEKIDAGADFIVTQFFYDTDVFIGYVEKCRGIGITCPIIPGVMAIQSYPSFLRMTQFCKTKVSSNITEMLEAVKDDDEAVKTKGVEIAVDMCQKLLREGYCDGVHFYTLNLERSVRRILEKVRPAIQRTTFDPRIKSIQCTNSSLRSSARFAPHSSSRWILMITITAARRRGSCRGGRALWRLGKRRRSGRSTGPTGPRAT